MAKFIALTNAHGREFCLNVDHVESVCSAEPYKNNDGNVVEAICNKHESVKSLVFTLTYQGGDDAYQVRESMHEIMRRIKL